MEMKHQPRRLDDAADIFKNFHSRRRFVTASKISDILHPQTTTMDQCSRYFPPPEFRSTGLLIS